VFTLCYVAYATLQTMVLGTSPLTIYVKCLTKKGGHLLGNVTRLPPWRFLLGQQVGHGWGGGWALKILLPIVGLRFYA